MRSEFERDGVQWVFFFLANQVFFNTTKNTKESNVDFC